jgi:hypothetical protein
MLTSHPWRTCKPMPTLVQHVSSISSPQQKPLRYVCYAKATGLCAKPASPLARLVPGIVRVAPAVALSSGLNSSVVGKSSAQWFAGAREAQVRSGAGVLGDFVNQQREEKVVGGGDFKRVMLVACLRLWPLSACPDTQENPISHIRLSRS